MPLNGLNRSNGSGCKEMDVKRRRVRVSKTFTACGAKSKKSKKGRAPISALWWPPLLEAVLKFKGLGNTPNESEALNNDQSKTLPIERVGWPNSPLYSVQIVPTVGLNAKSPPPLFTLLIVENGHFPFIFPRFLLLPRKMMCVHLQFVLAPLKSIFGRSLNQTAAMSERIRLPLEIGWGLPTWREGRRFR